MSEIVTKITHQVMVPNIEPSEIFSKTERVLNRPRVINLLPEFVYVPTITINYLFVGDITSQRQLEQFCYHHNVKPAHPVFMAADCISRPTFNDSVKAMTFWFDDEGLFCSANFYRLGGRSIDFEDRGVFLHVSLRAGDWWLATVAK